MSRYGNFEILIDGLDDNEYDNLSDTLLNTTTYVFYEDFVIMDRAWENWMENMISVSKVYPNALFTLLRVDYEDNETTRVYFKNGKFQNANVRVVFDEFDEGKLL